MVNIEDPFYKAMNKVDRIKFLDNLKTNANKKLDDTQVLVDMINKYKIKLAIERGKP